MALGERPDTISGEIWRPNRGQDPARYLVPDRNLFHRRPYLQSGSRVFTWPVGVEGFRRTGTSTLAVHRPIGKKFAAVHVVHLDEARIHLTGTFPGTTSVHNMVELIAVLTDEHPKILYMPGIFEREQYVAHETHDFSHSQDDRTHSIEYEVTFVRTGVGDEVADPHGTPAPANPSVESRPRGTAARQITTRDRMNTFRLMAQAAYGDPDLWYTLANMNRRVVNLVMAELNISWFQIPNYRWPNGTKFVY